MHFFDDILRYSHWANKAYAQVLQGLPPEQEVHRLFCHLLNAQIIWMERVKGVPPSLGVWQEHPPEQYEALNQKALGASLQQLDETPPDKIVAYRNSDGDKFLNSFGEILFHLVNHASYHRAQIAVLLKQQGLQPPPSDYIVYKRD